MIEAALFQTGYFDLICTAADVINACKHYFTLTTEEENDIGPFIAMNHTEDQYEEMEYGTASVFQIHFFPGEIMMMQSKHDNNDDDNERVFFTNPDVKHFSRAPLTPSFCQPYILKDDRYVKLEILETEKGYWRIRTKFFVPDIESFMSGGEVTFLFRFKIYAYHFKEQALRDLCFTSLSQNLSADNVADTLQMAKVYNMPQLVNQCLTFKKLNANITEKPNGDLVLPDNAEQITKMTLRICKSHMEEQDSEEESDDFYPNDEGDDENMEEEIDNWFEASDEEEDE